jgi:hypothetical protein
MNELSYEKSGRFDLVYRDPRHLGTKKVQSLDKSVIGTSFCASIRCLLLEQLPSLFRKEIRRTRTRLQHGGRKASGTDTWPLFTGRLLHLVIMAIPLVLVLSFLETRCDTGVAAFSSLLVGTGPLKIRFSSQPQLTIECS